MKDHSDTSRRIFLGGALASASSFHPNLALARFNALETAGGNVDDRARALAAALTGMPLPETPAHLALVSYGEQVYSDGVLLEAVVRLTWSPGERSRLFRAQARDPQSGLAQVLADVETVFGARSLGLRRG